MNFNKVLYIVAAGLIVALAFYAAAWTTSRAQDDVAPELLPLAEAEPLQPPPDGRRVALLNLAIASDESDRVIGVELREGFVRNWWAPNLFDKPGQWTIVLSAEGTEYRYGIPDPRRLEYVTGQTELDPMAYELRRDLEWQLAVPLWDDATDLGITRIAILDTEGNELFGTAVADLPELDG